jgi:hypothetical protein
MRISTALPIGHDENFTLPNVRCQSTVVNVEANATIKSVDDTNTSEAQNLSLAESFIILLWIFVIQ